MFTECFHFQLQWSIRKFTTHSRVFNGSYILLHAATSANYRKNNFKFNQPKRLSHYWFGLFRKSCGLGNNVQRNRIFDAAEWHWRFSKFRSLYDLSFQTRLWSSLREAFKRMVDLRCAIYLFCGKLMTLLDSIERKARHVSFLIVFVLRHRISFAL